MWFFTSAPKASPEEAAQKVRLDTVGLIDVRSPAEYRSGHAKGATNIPLTELDASRVEQLRIFSELYIICHSGARSAIATAKLRSVGISAFTVTGGISAWQALGLPIEQ